MRAYPFRRPLMFFRSARAVFPLLMLFLATGVPSGPAAASRLEVSVPSGPVRPGDRLEALLSLPPDGLTAVDLVFDFDPNVLSYLSSGIAPGAPQPFQVIQGELDGKPTLLFFYLDPLQGADPTPLVRAVFEVAGGAPSGPASIAFAMLVNGGVTDGGSDLLASASITVVPEPSMIALILGGLGALAVRRRFLAR